MLDRIFGRRQQSSSSNQSTQQQPPEDCLQCRLIGGGGLCAVGGYIIYYSFQRRNNPTTNKLTIFASAFVGSVVMTLGTLRLFGLNEFDNPPAARVKDSTKSSINDGQ